MPGLPSLLRLASPLGLALLCMLGGARAEAQARPGSYQAGYDFGRQYGGSFAKGTTPYFENRVEVDDNILHGFWIGTQLTETWGLELSVRRCPTQLIEPGPGIFAYQPYVADLSYGVIELSAVRSWHLGRFNPYWQAGAGVGTLQLDVPGSNWKTSGRPSFNGAVGARFWMAPWFAFRFDLRANAIYLGERGLGQDKGITDLGRWLRTQEITAGLQLSFGGR